MVHNVIMFVDGVHFGLAIKCADGWYKFQYASAGTESLTKKQSKDVTIKRSPPTGETKKSLEEIIQFARIHCGFQGTDYHLFLNNCRKFCKKLAEFIGVLGQYEKIVAQFGYLCA